MKMNGRSGQLKSVQSAISPAIACTFHAICKAQADSLIMRHGNTTSIAGLGVLTLLVGQLAKLMTCHYAITFAVTFANARMPSHLHTASEPHSCLQMQLVSPFLSLRSASCLSWTLPIEQRLKASDAKLSLLQMLFLRSREAQEHLLGIHVMIQQCRLRLTVRQCVLA